VRVKKTREDAADGGRDKGGTHHAERKGGEGEGPTGGPFLGPQFHPPPPKKVFSAPGKKGWGATKVGGEGFTSGVGRGAPVYKEGGGGGNPSGRGRRRKPKKNFFLLPTKKKRERGGGGHNKPPLLNGTGGNSGFVDEGQWEGGDPRGEGGRKGDGQGGGGPFEGGGGGNPKGFGQRKRRGGGPPHGPHNPHGQQGP